MRNEISYLITDFFTKYLINEAGYSRNTLESYRDVFILYFRFLNENKQLSPKKMDIEIFSIDIVNNFLEWIEEDLRCSINTRNQRLAVLKSFSNYAIRKNPEYSLFFQDILNIRAKKKLQTSVDYLSIEAISILIKQPDINTMQGIRDLAMISLMYETACRVQELIDLKYGDIFFQKPNTINLLGKGNKVRVVPISENVAKIVKKYCIKRNIKENESAVFTNRSHRKLTRSGITYILKKYTKNASKDNHDLFNIKMHPHVLRHSKSMHLLENGVNLIYIRDLLGHSSVTTTEIYARCNPEVKRKHLEQVANTIDGEIEDYTEVEKETLIEWLKNNI